MLITDSMTQLATLGRGARAYWANGAHLTAVTPIPVAPSSGGSFVKGTGLSTAPATALPAPATPPTNGRMTTARITDQTPAVTAGDSTLGNHVRRRPPV